MEHQKNKPSCQECGSSAASLFCAGGAAVDELIQRSRVTQRYKPGQYLFYAGNHPTGLYCVSKGVIKVETVDQTGKQHFVRAITKGGLVGYRSLFADESYGSSAVAIQESEVCYIPKQTIMKLLESNPLVAMQFLKEMADEFRALESRFSHATSFSARERVAEALLFLKDHHDEHRWSRKDIAEWAGTTPETVMRTLAEFEDAELIELKGRIIKVLNRNELLIIANVAV